MEQSTINPFELTPELKGALSHICNPELIQYHRGLAEFNPEKLDRYFLYTGRGPSRGSFHIGHLPSLKLVLDIQKHMTQKIFFMIAHDEKILRDDIQSSEMNENVKSTLAQLNHLGFTKENTQFHINSAHGIPDYPLLIKLMSMVSVNVLNHIFGEKRNIGEYFYPLLQILPCFLYPGKQCIVVSGKDQDPFFRLARDLAHRLKVPPPIVLYVHSVPGLDGSEKMSTSVDATIPIYLSDSVAIVKEKIMKIKKVGAGSLAELFEKGADLTIDIPYQLLKMFDPDIKSLDLIRIAYTTGVTDPKEKALLTELVSDSKGVKENDTKMMLTSYGIRLYLYSVLVKHYCV